jgi:hypothetical protein
VSAITKGEFAYWHSADKDQPLTGAERGDNCNVFNFEQTLFLNERTLTRQLGDYSSRNFRNVMRHLDPTLSGAVLSRRGMGRSGGREGSGACEANTIACLNIDHYRRLLVAGIDESKRQTVMRLLAEEETKLLK